MKQPYILKTCTCRRNLLHCTIHAEQLTAANRHMLEKRIARKALLKWQREQEAA